MPISTDSEKGKRIIEYLRKELQIPDDVIYFNIGVCVDDFIKVDCEYYPLDDKD